jgi:hypothetical protein
MEGDNENYLVNPNARVHLKAGLEAKSAALDKSEGCAQNLENLSDYDKSTVAYY